MVRGWILLPGKTYTCASERMDADGACTISRKRNVEISHDNYPLVHPDRLPDAGARPRRDHHFAPAGHVRIVYLAVGLMLGPMALGMFHFDPIEESHLLETLTEIAVLISLFSAGVKMPVPITLKRWSPPIRLAWVSMSLTVGLVAAFAYYVLGLPLGAGVLLGAILAPTDPVLATDVQVRHADDRDQLRFTLTCEAGMNDGSAFPFVMLGLGLLGAHELGDFGWRWLAVDVVWATLGRDRASASPGGAAARAAGLDAAQPASRSTRCWTTWSASA